MLALLETSHLHPDFCPLQSAPAIGGMPPDAKFGDALGAPPLADHPAPHNSDHNSELPNDPIGDFARATTPPSSQSENVATELRALLHSGKSTAKFAISPFSLFITGLEWS
jgi:hypothetical protein